jgi:hypothetical protein
VEEGVAAETVSSSDPFLAALPQVPWRPQAAKWARLRLHLTCRSFPAVPRRSGHAARVGRLSTSNRLATDPGGSASVLRSPYPTRLPGLWRKAAPPTCATYSAELPTKTARIGIQTVTT